MLAVSFTTALVARHVSSGEHTDEIQQRLFNQTSLRLIIVI